LTPSFIFFSVPRMSSTESMLSVFISPLLHGHSIAASPGGYPLAFLLGRDDP
jgi:hypothetical protein